MGVRLLGGYVYYAEYGIKIPSSIYHTDASHLEYHWSCNAVHLLSQDEQ